MHFAYTFKYKIKSQKNKKPEKNHLNQNLC
jgi:hypothetical protein